MEKYVFELLENNKINAGGKAKEDIMTILTNNGYSVLYFDPDMNRIEKLLFAPSIIKRKITAIKTNSEFVFQYPLYSKRFSKLLLTQLFKRNDLVKTVVIHDLESLRLHKNEKNYVQKEISIINRFDFVISHNSAMSDWLINNGVDSQKITNLSIFDYLNRYDFCNINLDKPVIFAGNLQKSHFLTSVPDNLPLNLYGLNPPEDLSDNIHYMGVFPPDKLPKYLTGSFGLIWDGNSSTTCNGIYGEYMRYNNPHKASLYLSSGIPVIIWKQAAMADFIVENQLGLAVDSLNDVNSEIAKLTAEDYQSILNNVAKVAEKLRAGYFTKQAIEQAKEVITKGV